MSLANALAKLDPKNDAHWTTDGLPKLEFVRLLASNPKVTREDIIAHDAAFNRTVAGLPVPVAPAAEAPADASVVKSPEQVIELLAAGAPVLQQVSEPETFFDGASPFTEKDSTLEDDIQRMQDELVELLAAKHAIERDISDAHAKLDSLLKEQQAGLGGIDKQSQSAIQQYLASQNEKAARQAELIAEHGHFKMVPVLQVSRLDQSLRQRHKRK
jgi:hypothetical protein